MTEKRRPKRRGERAERVSTAARRQRALELVRSGHRPPEVAAMLGVKVTTVYAYLGHPESRAALARTAGEPTSGPAQTVPVGDRACRLLGVGSAA